MPIKTKSISYDKKLGKDTLRTEIMRYILEEINKGNFKPGERIVETKLAKELNVSQAPVREAILELSVMGILERRPYSGTVVRQLTPEDIEDIYNTRAFIEEYAAKRAAKLVTDEQLKAFETTLKEMEVAAKNDRIKDFMAADIEFHELVLDAANSKALKHIWEILSMGEWTALTLQVTSRSLKELLYDHKMIYQYLAAHSDHSAGAAIFLHIKNFTNELVAYFEKYEQTAQTTSD
ncbi:GntR family transcriptional regulator [Tepidanaerobacter syntrophicus]|uniref:GntR family transcriptional regulator n=1 Tax=Tepidanaerobacter syntrophicus TaxID=224999 RepID=UPI001BD5B3CE|nr:GntR family transcriptional regulator [Tepidanaerobacter syntrophicus]